MSVAWPVLNSEVILANEQSAPQEVEEIAASVGLHGLFGE